MTPYRETRPYVGFMPSTPHRAAGWRMEPPVSVPIAPAQSEAATAAADPPDDPPGTCASDHGFRTAPRELFSFDEPIANSSMFSLPSITVPAAASRCPTVDSNGGMKPRRIFAAQVVSSPLVTKMSFSAIGTPARGQMRAPRLARDAMSPLLGRAGAALGHDPRDLEEAGLAAGRVGQLLPG